MISQINLVTQEKKFIVGIFVFKVRNQTMQSGMKSAHNLTCEKDSYSMKIQSHAYMNCGIQFFRIKSIGKRERMQIFLLRIVNHANLSVSEMILLH